MASSNLTLCTRSADISSSVSASSSPPPVVAEWVASVWVASVTRRASSSSMTERHTGQV
jgi:hypothetical protein